MEIFQEIKEILGTLLKFFCLREIREIFLVGEKQKRSASIYTCSPKSKGKKKPPTSPFWLLEGILLKQTNNGQKPHN